ncbi:MAG: hypothetical protein ACE5E7_14485 [Anaerolineae bacterium]
MLRKTLYRIHIHRLGMMLFPLTLAFIVTMVMVHVLAAEEEIVTPADLSGSQLLVDLSEATVGSTLQYTIIVSNSGGTLTSAQVTDTLPVSLTYLSGSLQSPTDLSVITVGIGESNGVITWTGSLGANSSATIQFSAVLTNSVQPGQIITNSVVITGAGSLITPSAATLVITNSPTSTLYFPIVYRAPSKPLLQNTRPNSANTWSVTWNNAETGVTGFELQEAQQPDFSDAVTYTLGVSTTSQQFSHTASFNNVYYYRARAVAGSVVGPWSDTLTVTGAYFDDFNDSSSGWAVRRMTFLEKTFAKYGTGAEAGNLVIIVDDRWDWLVASPLAPAPSLPYAIEYKARVHDSSNLVSGGMTFGGDWNYDACPEFGNVYQTDNCFNHFYNFNYIFHGPIKLLFEQVDSLFWCPNCGQSPLKRLGPTAVVDNIVDNASGKDWHTYRVEVRADGAYLYVDGSFVEHFTDTTWIDGPYFGVFASTDEYKPSIWLYEYFQVTPLD